MAADDGDRSGADQTQREAAVVAQRLGPVLLAPVRNDDQRVTNRHRGFHPHQQLGLVEPAAEGVRRVVDERHLRRRGVGRVVKGVEVPGEGEEADLDPVLLHHQRRPGLPLVDVGAGREQAGSFDCRSGGEDSVAVLIKAVVVGEGRDVDSRPDEAIEQRARSIEEHVPGLRLRVSAHRGLEVDDRQVRAAKSFGEGTEDVIPPAVVQALRHRGRLGLVELRVHLRRALHRRVGNDIASEDELDARRSGQQQRERDAEHAQRLAHRSGGPNRRAVGSGPAGGGVPWVSNRGWLYSVGQR